MLPKLRQVRAPSLTRFIAIFQWTVRELYTYICFGITMVTPDVSVDDSDVIQKSDDVAAADECDAFVLDCCVGLVVVGVVHVACTMYYRPE